MSAYPLGKEKPPWHWDVSVCPQCGAMTVEKNCKVICPKCGYIVENCNGD